MKYLLIALFVVFAAAQIWVRFAPVDVARWHRWGLPPMGAGDYPQTGGFLTSGGVSGPDDLAKLDAVIRATPSTRVLAGSVAEGMITYETRSAFWGFPDYTTVKLSQNGPGWNLAIHGRLRFGRSDLGVNRKRIEGWLTKGISLTKP